MGASDEARATVTEEEFEFLRQEVQRHELVVTNNPRDNGRLRAMWKATHGSLEERAEQIEAAADYVLMRFAPEDPDCVPLMLKFLQEQDESWRKAGRPTQLAIGDLRGMAS